MSFSVIDIIGTSGVVAIIGTYILLQLGKIDSKSLAYSLLNAVGASLIIVSLYFNFNLSAFVVEFFWLLISLYGIGSFFFNRSSMRK